MAKESDYYNKLHRATWSRRTAGFLAGATLFGAIGAIGGAVAAFLPYALGAMGVAGAAAVGVPSLAAIGSSIALFAGAAAFLGVVIGADVGSSAGSVAAGLAEKENREGRTGSATAQEPAKPVKWFNARAAATFTAIFAGFGALVALNPATAVGTTMMGFSAGTAAASAASATTLGMLGTSLGINFPEMTSRLSNFYMRLFSGETVPKAAKSELINPQPKAEVAPELAMTPELNQPSRSFASDTRRFSLSSIVDKTEERSSDTIVTR